MNQPLPLLKYNALENQVNRLDPIWIHVELVVKEYISFFFNFDLFMITLSICLTAQLY